MRGNKTTDEHLLHSNKAERSITGAKVLLCSVFPSGYFISFMFYISECVECIFLVVRSQRRKQLCTPYYLILMGKVTLVLTVGKIVTPEKIIKFDKRIVYSAIVAVKKGAGIRSPEEIMMSRVHWERKNTVDSRLTD